MRDRVYEFKNEGSSPTNYANERSKFKMIYHHVNLLRNYFY